MKTARRKFAILFLTMAFAAVFSACQTSAPKISENINLPDGMVLIKGGSFEMGESGGMPFESPVHTVEIDSFLIDEHEVTTAEFAKFVEATNYRTEAEIFGWSAVFDFDSGEWKRVDGADWRHPEGKNSAAAPDEPVTQISWNDATRYAKWAGKRLPSEAEFEFAARGGLARKKYAWGDELKPGGKILGNWWQGTFPGKNTREDGYLSRAPVKSFAPNGYGLYDMTGNVWEWTADWFDENYYAASPKKNPQGALQGTEKSIRGGSFLCAENFCSNYRVAGRSRSTPDSGMNNLGFRCAKDVTK
jgi:formylglycine-generating enzyme